MKHGKEWLIDLGLTLIIALLVGFALVTSVRADTWPTKRFGPYQSELVRVADGDTVWMKMHTYPDETKTTKIRLREISAPETRSNSKRKVPECEKALGRAATAFTEQWLAGRPRLIVSDLWYGSYPRRMVGRISAGGEYLGKALLASGHARVPIKPFVPWCSG